MKKLVVLIVDDSLVIIERFIEILNEINDIELVLYASNYAEGQQLLTEIKPDIALLDINLPDKSGIELLRHIRDLGLGIKVIMITNQATNHYKKICASLGANHFFDKSNEFEQIPDIISGFRLN